jgi:hypothetical protein
VHTMALAVRARDRREAEHVPKALPRERAPRNQTERNASHAGGSTSRARPLRIATCTRQSAPW